MSWNFQNYIPADYLSSTQFNNSALRDVELRPKLELS